MTNKTPNITEALSKLDVQGCVMLIQVLASQATSLLLEANKVKEDLGMTLIKPKGLEVPKPSTSIIKPKL